MIEKSLKILEYDRVINELASFASSSRAKRQISELRPMSDKYELQRQIDLTEEAYNLMMKLPNLHVGGIMDISDSLKLAEIGSHLSAGKLLDVAQTLRSSRMLAAAIKKAQAEDFTSPKLLEIASFVSSFSNIEDSIFSAIVSEVEIADSASKKLYNIRRAIDSKKAGIRDKLERLSTDPEMQKFLQESIVTIRDERFVIPVRSEYKSRVDGIVHDKSKGGSTFYIEPSAVVNMNNELKSLMIDEQEEIRRILIELTTMIAAEILGIKISYESVCDLDYAFAKGKFALNMDASKPIIVESGKIKIRQGRHPFIDKKICVPIDYEMGEGYNALIITGPNTGGKTVSLKTVALLSAMALSGLFVPANSRSCFGHFTRIYADIGDEQSIDQSLSTFSSHMKNIVRMVCEADENSLLLFDELGAGTDPTEGAALAIAILKTVQLSGASVIATTHYSELKQFALVTEGFQNASVEFDVEKLVPTYKLSIGVPGKSNAFEISRRLGLDEQIINSARQLITGDDIAFEDVLVAIESKKSAAEKDRDAAAELKRQNEALRQKLEEREEKTRELRERTLGEAKIEARRIIASAKQTAEDTLKDLKNIDPSAIHSKAVLELKQRLSEEDKKNRANLGSPSKEAGEVPNDFVVGEEYFVLTLNKNAVLIGLDEEKDECEVKAGIMKLFVNKSELRVASKRKEKKKLGIYDAKNTMAYGTNVSAVRSGSTEIDLHGKDVLQATYELDKFLDEAILSGLNQLSVIHGLGTGTLKRAVQAHLKSHPMVKKIRGGVHGEGGAGVTVVTLK